MLEPAKIVQIAYESIFATIIFFKIIASSCKLHIKIVFSLLFSSTYTIVYTVLTGSPVITLVVIVIFIFSLVMNILDHNSLGAGSYCAVLFLSMAVVRIGTLLSGALVYPLVLPLGEKAINNLMLMVILCIPLLTLYVFLILRMKLFKYKFHTWLDKHSSRFVILGCWFLLCLLSFYGTFLYENTRLRSSMLFLVGMSIVLSFLWLVEETKKTQKNIKLKEANRQLSAEVHKSKEFLPSIHKVIQKQAAGAVPRGVQTELARMAQEQELETRCALLEYDPVSATGLYLLDEQLADYRREAIDKDVDLFISVQDPVAPLVENGVITQIRLQRLIGDLMRNAFNAIDRRPSGPRGQILLLLGLTADGCYEIDVCDNGAPFPAWVLENLGVRGTTTGGTGNGMADIFDTLALCKASFTLQKESEGQLYTKHITISFDGTGRLAIDH